MALKEAQIAEDTKYNKETEVLVANLKKEIEKLEAEEKLKSETLANEQMVNREESKRNRMLA